MSISNLTVPNDYNLFVNSLTVNDGVDVGSNQIYWNSYSANSSGDFIGPGTEVATYPNAQAVTNKQLTITALRVLLSAAPGIGQSWTFTLYVNGGPTPMSVTISDTSISATDTTALVVLNPGFTFAIGLTSTAGATSGFSTICMNYI
jgi:hypothetical protein